jgi:hypothetical protein
MAKVSPTLAMPMMANWGPGPRRSASGPSRTRATGGVVGVGAGLLAVAPGAWGPGVTVPDGEAVALGVGVIG